jgi:hypothetical protein
MARDEAQQLLDFMRLARVLRDKTYQGVLDFLAQIEEVAYLRSASGHCGRLEATFGYEEGALAEKASRRLFLKGWNPPPEESRPEILRITFASEAQREEWLRTLVRCTRSFLNALAAKNGDYPEAHEAQMAVSSFLRLFRGASKVVCEADAKGSSFRELCELIGISRHQMQTKEARLRFLSLGAESPAQESRERARAPALGDLLEEAVSKQGEETAKEDAEEAAAAEVLMNLFCPILTRYILTRLPAASRVQAWMSAVLRSVLTQAMTLAFASSQGWEHFKRAEALTVLKTYLQEDGSRNHLRRQAEKALEDAASSFESWLLGALQQDLNKLLELSQQEEPSVKWWQVFQETHETRGDWDVRSPVPDLRWVEKVWSSPSRLAHLLPLLPPSASLVLMPEDESLTVFAVSFAGFHSLRLFIEDRSKTDESISRATVDALKSRLAKFQDEALQARKALDLRSGVVRGFSGSSSFVSLQSSLQNCVRSLFEEEMYSKIVSSVDVVLEIP